MTKNEPGSTAWQRSKRSGSIGDCVECSFDADEVHLRDSKDPHGPSLTFNHASWRAFISGVKNGEFDL
jgi:hypothetical protein